MLQWLVEFEPVSRKSEWVDEWKKRRPRGGADAKWNYPTLDRVSGIVGISMQNGKSIKINKNKKTKTKEGVNSVVLLGKEEEEKKKKEMKAENEGKKMKEERFGYALWVHCQ